MIKRIQPVSPSGGIGRKRHEGKKHKQMTNLDKIIRVGVMALHNKNPEIKKALELKAHGAYEDIYERNSPNPDQRLRSAITNNEELQGYIAEHFKKEIERY